MTIYMTIRKKIILATLFLGTGIVGLFYVMRYPQFFLGRGQAQPSMVSIPSRNASVFVEVARDPYTWSKGLMFRESLASDAGMLFVFPDSTKRSFWMKDTLIPLDMLFISRDRKIVTIHRNAEPCKALFCPSYTSTDEAMYVLEVNGGFADAHDIREGDVVEIAEK